MKSTEQKKSESHPPVKQARRPASAATAVPAKQVEESDSATIPPVPKQSPPTTGKSSDQTKLPFDLESYQKHGRVIAIMMASYQLRHLNRLYREFDGDLVLPIILGEIGHYNAMRFFSSQGYVMNAKDIPTDPESHLLLRPCNAFSISEATGIPRETVRRKVEKLIAMGWLRRDSRGHLFITAKPYEHFAPEFNVESLQEDFQSGGTLQSAAHRCRRRALLCRLALGRFVSNAWQGRHRSVTRQTELPYRQSLPVLGRLQRLRRTGCLLDRAA